MLRECALIATLSLPAWAASPKIVVLKSGERSAYGAVAAGFAAEVKASVETVTIEDAPEAALRSTDRVAAEHPALVLAIGPTAAVNARRVFDKVPVLFCMVPYYEKYGLEASNVTGIAMAPDFAVQLAALKAAWPAAVRVGVLHDPRFSSAIVEELRQASRDRGMSVVPLEVETESSVPRVLGTAHGKVDALAMVGDKTVATAPVVRKLISFADDEHVPLLALSASQVKEGALLALSATPVAIGQQAGRLANRVLFEKVDPGALAVAPPEGLEISVNVSAAKKLGARPDWAAELLRFAGARGLSVRPFE